MMNERRPPKKSDTLEVRVPHEVKNALMSKARAEGRSASDVIRSSIDAYLADRSKEKPSMLVIAWKPLAVAGTAALAIVWAGLAPAPVAAGPDLRAAFQTFDANKDGVVTLDEFRQRHSDDRLFVHSEPGDHPIAQQFTMPLHHSPQAFENGVPVPTAMLNGEFAKQDKDHNGSVDFNEFKSFHVAMMAASFGQMDRNKDGGIDAAEFAAIAAMLPPGSPQPGFSDLDVNHDGKLDQSEFFGHEE